MNEWCRHDSGDKNGFVMAETCLYKWFRNLSLDILYTIHMSDVTKIGKTNMYE